MPVDGWFPQVSPNGFHVASGAEQIYVDGVLVGPGVQPVWLTDDEILYRDREEPRLWRFHIHDRRLTTIPLGSGCNEIAANGRGQWAGYFSRWNGAPHCVTWDQKAYPGYGAAIGPDGSVAFHDESGQVVVVAPNGARGMLGRNSRVVTWTDGGLAWVEENERHWPTVGGYQPVVNDCHRVFAVASPHGRHLLVLESRRLILYDPLAAPMGHIVAEGEDTFNPHARWNNDGFRVVWSTGRGELCETHIPYARQTVNLKAVAPPPPDPVDPKPPPVDPQPEPKPMNNEFASFRWSACTILKGDESIGAWPITTPVTAVSTDDSSITLECDDSRWEPFQYSDGGPAITLVGSKWVVAKIDGQWFAATYDGRRPGQHEKGESRFTLGKDQIRRAPMDASWVLQPGEVFGLFDSTAAVNYYAENGRQRTPIVWTRYGTSEIYGVEDKGPIVGPPEKPVEPSQPPPPDLTPLAREIAVLRADVAVLREALDRVHGEVYESRADLAKLTELVAAEGQATRAAFKAGVWRGEIKASFVKGAVRLTPEA